MESHATRSSNQKCSMQKGILRNLAKFTGKHLCQSLFFNKVAGLRPETLLKKGLWQRCFPTNYVKFLRTPFLSNTSSGCFYATKYWNFKTFNSFNAFNAYNGASTCFIETIYSIVTIKIEIFFYIIKLMLTKIKPFLNFDIFFT